ncbi:hypothetical protein TCAL_09715 [Tigriopus californicus]|uniref:Uncharacterized protein n=1 Tax=Tigriopus californicus TaxID=6832 RepID=A0A553P3V9_TIGCA|nr:uncharacterized protein LOC131883649 [Tigriopus californicus]TRY72374.1 hypothetical protein TCAL_09715 [Tigriopus californicus]|eukprot:TCALIF_09715-PA protein Name:"Protein of unknown function" AED:0.00 eAED:0.00 QI:0/1/0.8/1/1/1/5/21/628
MTTKPARGVHFKIILVCLAFGLPLGHEVIAKEYDKHHMQNSNSTKKVETKMEHSASNKTHVHRQETEKKGIVDTKKEGWTADELECPNSGVLHRQCTFKCHKISERDNSRICSTITDVKRCSCSGMKMELKDKIVYDLETGIVLTQTSGFDSISGLCKSCVETCKKVPESNKKKLKSGWKKISFHCTNESEALNQTSVTDMSTLIFTSTTVTTPEAQTDYSEEETEEISEEYSDEMRVNSGETTNSTVSMKKIVDYDTLEESSEEIDETEEASSEESVSEQYSASPEAVKAREEYLEVAYSEDTLEDYNNPSYKDKALFSERVIARPNAAEEYYDPYLYNIYDDVGDLVRDRRSTDDSLQELTYYNDEQDLGQMLVEDSPPTLAVEYQENIERLGSDESLPEQDRVVHRPKPKNTHHHPKHQKATLAPSNDYENYIETPNTNQTTKTPHGTSDDKSTTTISDVTNSIEKHNGSSRALEVNQTNIGSALNQELGNSLENRLLVETQFHPPTIDRSKPCSPMGNETRFCTEDCAQDGKTCVMKVELNRCTCSGYHVVLTEIQKWDMIRNEDVFLSTPDGQHYGTGYVRECGSCVDYCRDWPGEIKEHQVNTAGLSCKEVAESFDNQKKDD